MTMIPRRALRSIIGTLVLLGCVRAGWPPAPDPKAPVDVYILMEEVRSLEGRPLWPGFEPAKIPAAIFDGEKTYLFGFPKRPRGFDRIPDRPDTYVFPGQHAAVRANRRTEIDGVRAAACIARFPGLRASLRDLAATIIHEKFHVFQAVRHPDWRPNDAHLFNYPADTADSVLLRRLEVEAFKRAVAAADPEDMRGWAALSLQYHRDRVAPLPAELARYEDEVQCLEGLAEYIEWQVIGRGLFERYYDLDFAPAAIRNYGYISGRWIGYVLDKIDLKWKADLEARVYQYPRERLAVIARPAEGRCRFSPAEIASWKARSEADLKTQQARLAEVRRDFAKSSVRIVIEAGRKPLWLRFFLANESDTFNEREMLHHRWLTLANDVCDLEIIGRDVLTVSDGKPNVVRVEIPLLNEMPELATENGRGVIRAAGVVIRYTRASVVKEAEAFVLRFD